MSPTAAPSPHRERATHAHDHGRCVPRRDSIVPREARSFGVTPCLISQVPVAERRCGPYNHRVTVSLLPGRRFAAALLLPLVIVAGVASSSEQLRCRMDGVVRSVCCCAHDAASPTTPTFQRAGCCDTVSHATEPSPSVEQRTIHVELPVLLAVVSQPPSVAAVLRLEQPPCALAETSTRSTTGPPLFLLHRALLI